MDKKTVQEKIGKPEIRSMASQLKFIADKMKSKGYESEEFSKAIENDPEISDAWDYYYEKYQESLQKLQD